MLFRPPSILDFALNLLQVARYQMNKSKLQCAPHIKFGSFFFQEPTIIPSRKKNEVGVPEVQKEFAVRLFYVKF